ncbi:MAG: DUF2115 domain-containing protein [Methanobacterium sp.]|jgi:uncharacterized protein (UPF0305 family)|uniref:DUF2115 domain-containing protein n=1 Tax=unclassified Methanobacterium TaxID=2627676 RepID=UPI000C2D2751|nr:MULTISPECIES: DUF2115 domain-containing protein [unclassified Methanobacterium]AUB58056.1 hypothetical protein BK008_06855 [Methanobacterium sp. MZ-A1]MCC7559251.1 DUF2115 domain-containing protein [Methanobacterium sp.]
MVIKKIVDILSCNEIQMENLLTLLKMEARLITLQDLMQASLFLIDDAQFIQGSYRQEYVKAYTLAFINRIKEVKEYNQYNNEYLDVQEVQDAVILLLEQEKQAGSEDGFDPAFFQIYKIISIYTTFILEEPVHPVGTPFPGGLKVKYDGERYLCPVKERQKNNPGAVCGFCVAEQDPETI